MSNQNSKSKYYQKSSFILRIAKYICSLLFIIFLLTCIIVFRKDITLENIRLLAKFISFESHSEYSGEFSVSLTDESNVIMLRNNLGIIDNTSISLYDLSGQKLFSYSYSLSSPALTYDNHSIVVHDIEGESLMLFNSFSKIKDFKYGSNVLSANVNDNYLSVITRDESYTAKLYVYEYNYHERDYIEKFTLKSASFLTCSAVSHNGRYVITSATDADEGRYSSSLNIYDTTKNSAIPLASYAFSDELPIKIGFTDDYQSCYIITDSAVHFVKSDFAEADIVKFNQSKVLSFYEDENSIILTERNNLSGNSVMLVCITKHGVKEFEINIPDEVIDLTFGEKSIFVLGKKCAYKISKNTDKEYTVSTSTPFETKYLHIVCDTKDNCFVIDDSVVRHISFE